MTSIPRGRFEAPHRVRMGLTALAPGESWIEVDADRDDDLREKRRLFAVERERVLQTLPGSEPAQREVRDVVARELAERHPALATSLDRGDDRLPAIEAAALLVQEDLCVMERRDAGWCLTAAAVCFPTRWDMPPKMGLPLTAIHDPVPTYRERVAASADRFFDLLEAGRVFRRANWSLLDDPALFQPVALRGGAPVASIAASDADTAVWLRVERQTLQRLPASGAILFSIRIHRAPLGALADDPDAAASLAAAVRSMEPAMVRYKALARVQDAALAYLDAVSTRRPR